MVLWSALAALLVLGLPAVFRRLLIRRQRRIPGISCANQLAPLAAPQPDLDRALLPWVVQGVAVVVSLAVLAFACAG